MGRLVKFREQSHHFLLGNQCFYVGKYAKKSSKRINKNKDGYKSNTYARRIGLKIVQEFYEK